MSHIAILAIPVYASDIANREAYDFEPADVEPTMASNELGLENLGQHQRQGRLSRLRWLKEFKDRVRPPASPRIPKGSSDEPAVQQPSGVFGVPLSQSMRYSNVEISVMDKDGKTFTFGYIPTVVAKTGVFLKEKGQRGDPPCVT